MPLTHVTRVAPSGLKLDVSHRTTIACGASPGLLIWEKTITLPGIDGGDIIDTTTMWNDNLHTFTSRVLRRWTDGQVVFAFSGSSILAVDAIINIETNFTILLPNTGKLSFWGIFRAADGASMETDGGQPEATGHFNVTNTNPTTGVEEGPIYTGPVGGSGPP